MEERKLTDEEIIKAYEYCCVERKSCEACPYNDWGCAIDGNDLLSVINRQKAEIERLTEERQSLVTKLNQTDEAVDYWCDKFKAEKAEKDELQKQVDELEGKFEKEYAEFMVRQAKAIHDAHERGVQETKYEHEQAVKDTAKEIFARLAKRKHQGFDGGGFFVEYALRLEDLNWFEVRYGVEVEV